MFYTNCYRSLVLFEEITKKWSILMIITVWANDYFLCNFWPLSIGLFHFCISRHSKFNSMGWNYVLICKTHIYMLKMILASLLTQISFSNRIFANFWHITYFVSNLMPIWPWSWSWLFIAIHCAILLLKL